MTTLSRWIRITGDGVAEVRVGKVELGQGILTALGQLAADELDLAMDRVRMLPAHTADGPDEGLTAGSMSIATSGPALRLACANVRALLMAEAARRWQVPPTSLTVKNGTISHGAKEIDYGDLADAVDLNVEVHDMPVKPADELRITGTDVPRIDLPDKIAGRPRFIADLRPPGLRHGRVVRPPSPGAQLISTVDVPGMVRNGSFLGVVGDDEATVVRAAERLRRASTWSETATLPDENALDEFLLAGPHETITVADDGEAPTGKRLRARYSRPFLAHASIAPSCGIARWNPNGTVDVWSHSQGITLLQKAIAAALSLAPSMITVQHAENAGCYGHNAADDAAFDAVLLARTVPGHPVQVLWTRRDELTWAPFGSAMLAEIEATTDDAGHLLSWRYDVWSQGHISRPGYAGVPGLLAATHLADPAVYPAAVDPPAERGGGTTRNAAPGYDVGVRRIRGHRLLESPIRTSAMRALGAFTNVFAIESFMDELAKAADQDPLDYRLAHLNDDRARQVLTTAAEAADWGSPSGGRGLGFARYKGNGAYCAVVAEVEAEHDIRVRRLTITADVGLAVNPDGVRNQLEGGATQATSWTLKERVRFNRTRITSGDWESYPILRFSEVPDIQVVLVSRPDAPSVGAGECAQGPTAAALANAVAAATGVRVRDLPITTEAVVRAIE